MLLTSWNAHFGHHICRNIRICCTFCSHYSFPNQAEFKQLASHWLEGSIGTSGLFVQSPLLSMTRPPNEIRIDFLHDQTTTCFPLAGMSLLKMIKVCTNHEEFVAHFAFVQIMTRLTCFPLAGRRVWDVSIICAIAFTFNDQTTK